MARTNWLNYQTGEIPYLDCEGEFEGQGMDHGKVGPVPAASVKIRGLQDRSNFDHSGEGREDLSIRTSIALHKP